MEVFTRAAAAVEALALKGANIDVAAHWLSSWHGDRPPSSGGFDTQPIWRHTAALAVFEVREDTSLTCISAGAYYRMALGYDLVGQDVLSITTVPVRAERLRWCWNIVEGAVTVSQRAYNSKEHGHVIAQGVSLPFSDRRLDGSGRFLMHINWRPVGTDWIEGQVAADAQPPEDRRLISYVKALDTRQ